MHMYEAVNIRYLSMSFAFYEHARKRWTYIECACFTITHYTQIQKTLLSQKSFRLCRATVQHYLEWISSIHMNNTP